MIKPFLTELRAVFKSAIGHSLGVLTLALGAVLILAGLVGSDQVEANRAPTPIAVTLDIAPSTATTDADVYSTVQVSGEQAGYNASWRDMEVRKGDSLSMIFGRAGLDSTDLQSVLDADARSKSLRSIYPGQTVSIKVDSEGRLSEMRYARSPLETRIFTRNGEGFSVAEETRSPEVRKAFRHANLKSSLFEAGQEAGLSGRMILELASVFGGVIDFVLDPRAGDSFSVLYEEQYLDGEKVGEGAIIAAEYVNDGKRFAAYRYTDSNGDQGYFSADGVSMRKAFMLAPLDFTRVSSNFNMRRMHPIMKVIRPHRGVDYSASTGTPVYASGDGKVTASGYSRSNGNYVYIQHDNRYMTRYLHLHKRTVKPGERVKQGQTIGTVGATGLATGPHLHYEFLVDGVHKNPRTALESLPRARTLAGKELASFRAKIAGEQTQLATYTNAWEMAIVSGAE
ncbi:MAG: peptidoglycan DD-metalloendopeptidase family protein [Gammaproteobacteria bacterium]|jgi:murein DD-endopeptidase MepM/ murein hydrolase activator NlpD|nr:peptidoglycan DD-metalloendopeptidase family protein [Gammaproteobacteria bacterium]MBK8991521.1 peptidoglycan DD-metalloendopeptidase family protein [Gammaproteobacteria bacterium]MBK9470061.1 peptidoglycan DD-metalloendopeptidase family protein [Gammaproteobacteria bacterium]MBP7910596.1 peptidoglycan DD-metalloendopeptidase family protein [Pseudomonadales bacterium]